MKGGGTFDLRRRHLRPEEAAPSTRGGGTFEGRRCRLRKTPISDAFYSNASYLSKFTEFAIVGYSTDTLTLPF